MDCRGLDVEPVVGDQRHLVEAGHPDQPEVVAVPPPAADILALKHVSRILGHRNNPALPFCPVCGRGISSCSVLKYWLENEEQEMWVCCNVRESY